MHINNEECLNGGALDQPITSDLRSCTIIKAILWVLLRAPAAAAEANRHQKLIHSALLQGLSIACSTPEAIAWDKEWANTHEISGRAMKAVHDSGSDFKLASTQATKASSTKLPNGRLANGVHKVKA